MKKYLLIIAAAAACMLVACSKEKELRIPEEETVETGNVHLPGWTYIGATIGEEETKARIDPGDDATFTWCSGEKIAVFAGDTYHVSSGLSSSYHYTNSAEFAFEGGINASRSDFAVYPASLVYDGTQIRPNSNTNHTAASLTITLPNTYSYDDVNGNKAVTPMIAVNAPNGGLVFKSICALLRITVQNVPKDAASFKVTFPGKKVCGEFTLLDFTAGTDGVQVVASSANGEDDTITITDLPSTGEFNASGLVINLPVPIGHVLTTDYPYVRVAAYDLFDDGTHTYSHKINSIDAAIVKVNSEPKVWSPNRLTCRKCTAALPYFTSNNKIQKKIVFAPGNLRATITKKPLYNDPIGAANNWRFAAHQYDALGDYVGNRVMNVGDSLDLFAWVGTSASWDGYTDEANNKYGVVWANYNVTTGTYVGNLTTDRMKYQFGELFNGKTYPADTWRLPNGSSKSDSSGADYDDKSMEWTRLLNQRTTTSGYVAAKAAIITSDTDTTLIRGMIIFPDTYSHPYGFKTLNNCGRNDNSSVQASWHWKDNIITKSEWDILENVGGCVFLPITSCRAWVSSASNTSSYFGEWGYWADECNAQTGNAALACIGDNQYCQTYHGDSPLGRINPGKSVRRTFGGGIRLIRDVN